MTNHPNRSRQRTQRIAAEAERWAPILRGLSPYEAAQKVRRQICDPITEDDTLMLAGALLAFAGDGWQPIETAPKTGEPVLGFMPSYFQGKGGISVIHWMLAGGRIEPGPDDGDWFDSRAWRTTPTHWRPLPAPPSDKSPHGEQG